MIEQSPLMTKHINKKVTIHQQKVQDFKWPKNKYDTIACIWGFCYLNKDDQDDTLLNMDQALKDGGQAIIFEPVLSKQEKQEARMHENEDQQMAIRPVTHYDTFFQLYHWHPFHKKIYEKSGINNEDMVCYVFHKNY